MSSQGPDAELMFADDDRPDLVPVLRDLVAALDRHDYQRTAVLPMPGRRADLCFDPVNISRAVRGQPNLFHPSAAAGLFHASLGRRHGAAVALHRMFFLGEHLPLGHTRTLLGAALTDSLLDARVLARDGDGVLTRVLAAPYRGRTLLADPFRAREHPDYCYLGRSSFTAAEYLRRRPLARGGRLLDLACGSGVGALTCADGFDEIVGTDIVPRCLRFARINAELNGLGRARFDYSDVFSDVGGSFDLIIANTPCVWTDQAAGPGRTYESGGAEFGLELPARMISGALDRLRPGGTVLAVIMAPEFHGRPYAGEVLGRVCGERPVRVQLHPLLAEFDHDSADRYRRHGISLMARYLAVLQFADAFSVSFGRFDAPRALSYRARTGLARAVARRRSRG